MSCWEKKGDDRESKGGGVGHNLHCNDRNNTKVVVLYCSTLVHPSRDSLCHCIQRKIICIVFFVFEWIIFPKWAKPLILCGRL